MQHPGQHEIVDEARPAEPLVGNIDAGGSRSRDATRRCGFGCHARSRLAGKQGVVGELPVACTHVSGPGDDAIVDAKSVGRHAEPLRRDAEVDRARLRAGVAEGDA